MGGCKEQRKFLEPAGLDRCDRLGSLDEERGFWVVGLGRWEEEEELDGLGRVVMRGILTVEPYSA